MPHPLPATCPKCGHVEVLRPHYMLGNPYPIFLRNEHPSAQPVSPSNETRPQKAHLDRAAQAFVEAGACGRACADIDRLARAARRWDRLACAAIFATLPFGLALCLAMGLAPAPLSWPLGALYVAALALAAIPIALAEKHHAACFKRLQQHADAIRDHSRQRRDQVGAAK